MYSYSAPAADPADVLRAVQALETFFENAKVDPVQCAYCATSFDAQDGAGLWAFGAGEDPPEESEDWFRLDAEQFRLKDLWDQAEGVFFEVAYRGRRPPKEAYIGCVIPFPLIGVPDQSDYEPPPDLEARMAKVDAIHAQFENPLSAECEAAIEELDAIWGKADKERVAKRRAASPLPARTLSSSCSRWTWPISCKSTSSAELALHIEALSREFSGVVGQQFFNMVSSNWDKLNALWPRKRERVQAAILQHARE